MNFYARIMCMLLSCTSTFLLVINPLYSWIKLADKRKLMMRINLTTFLLISFFLQVGLGATAQKITLSERNISLPHLLEKISLQSGYDFFYTNEMLNEQRTVNVNFKNVELTEVLEHVFKGYNLQYAIKYKTVVIQRRMETLKERLLAEQSRITVRGVITDGTGKAIAGAGITEKGTSNRTSTDANGTFSLPVSENAILVISYVGYATQEIPVKNNNLVLTITLSESLNKLQEVGVISTGYQKIKKDQLTGAASTMDEKQYQQREAVTGNFLESLEGKIPGLVYNGQTRELAIRGVSTFDAVKQPLIVLDGFPTEIDLRTINPNDIVSISVLRDASAASIYGVRASNGVIIVETRRGKAGKPVFNLKSTYAIQNKPDFSYLKYAPASEFVQLQKEYFGIANPPFITSSRLDPVQEILFGRLLTQVSNPLLTQAQADAKLQALASYDNLKEYESLFYQTKQTKNVNFDLSGGNEKSTYMLGLNYINSSEVTRRSLSKQLTLNVANTYKLSERFNFDFKGTYTNYADESGNTPPYQDFYPYEHLADENGVALPVAYQPNRTTTRNINPTQNTALMGLGLYDTFYYPYRELTSNTNTLKGSTARFQGRLNAKISNWLSMDLGGNYENQNAILDNLRLENTYSVRNILNASALKDAQTGRAIFKNMPTGDVLSKTGQLTTNYTIRGQLNFNHKFGGEEHDFSGILGVERKKTLSRDFKTAYFGYNGQTLISKPVNMDVLNSLNTPVFRELGQGNVFRSTDYFNQTENDRRFMSYYGQGTYIFKRKYVATGSFRVDQSNLFGVDPKYKNKPLWSAGVNWRAGEEDFLKQLGWVEQLQFRAATGFNGNVPTSKGGAFLILGTGLNTLSGMSLPYTNVISPENQSLRWETTKNYNLGLDYSLWKGRISGSVDWYLKKTKDVFGRFDADPTLGFNEYNANTASIQNTGLEFLINSSNVKHGQFEWRTQLTASFNNNKVLAVKATQFSYSNQIASGTQLVKGAPIGALYSYNYGGLNEQGQPFVFDKSGNKKVMAYFGNPLVDVGLDDMVYNGTTTPKYVLGLNNQFSVGAFDLSFLFMYYGGHVMRVEQPNPMHIGMTQNNPLRGSGNYWKKAGDENDTRIPGFVAANSLAAGYYPSSARNAYEYASEFVRKADYIRLRDVVITYNANAQFLEKLGLNRTQLRFQAQNAFRYTFSGNDIDPDAIDRITGRRMLEIQPFYSLTFSTNF